jgi:hypothetical protein
LIFAQFANPRDRIVKIEHAADGSEALVIFHGRNADSEIRDGTPCRDKEARKELKSIHNASRVRDDNKVYGDTPEAVKLYPWKLRRVPARHCIDYGGSAIYSLFPGIEA